LRETPRENSQLQPRLLRRGFDVTQAANFRRNTTEPSAAMPISIIVELCSSGTAVMLISNTPRDEPAS